jgi:hypothetical protein
MSALSSFKRLGGQLMLGPRGELGHVSDAYTFQLDHELTRAFANYTVHYLKEYLANPDDHLFRVALVFHSKQPHPWGSETLRLTDDVVRMIYPVNNIGSRELTSFQKKKRENSVHFGTELLLTYAMKDTPGMPIFLPILFDRGTTLMQYENFTSSTVMLTEPLDTPVLEVLNLVGPAMAARKNLDAFVALREQLERTLIKHDARRPVEMKIMESGHAPSVTTRPSVAPPPRVVAAAPTAPPPAPRPPTPFSGTGTTTAMSGSAFNPDTNSKQWYNPALEDVTCEKLSQVLSLPRAYTEIEQIRQFARFQGLSASQQSELMKSCPVYVAPSNVQLLDRGSSDQWNLYLLQGQIELTAADGEKKIVVGGSENARNAIAALKPRKFSVTSLTPVRFLWIHENMVAEIQQRLPGDKLELM